MLLENKNAVIYEAGGSIGGEVARGSAREGARVFLVGHTSESLRAVAKDIAGPRADGIAGDATRTRGGRQVSLEQCLDKMAAMFAGA